MLVSNMKRNCEKLLVATIAKKDNISLVQNSFFFSDTAVLFSEAPAEHANTNVTILITNTSGVILAQRTKE